MQDQNIENFTFKPLSCSLIRASVRRFHALKYVNSLDASMFCTEFKASVRRTDASQLSTVGVLNSEVRANEMEITVSFDFDEPNNETKIEFLYNMMLFVYNSLAKLSRDRVDEIERLI